MKKTLLVFTLAAAALFSSCNKNEDTEADPVKPVKLLTKMLDENGGVRAEYKYDNQNHLIEVISDNEGTSGREVLSYDNSGKLVKYEEFRGQELRYTKTYTYNGDILTSGTTQYHDADYPSSSSQNFTMNSKGQLLEVVSVSQQNNTGRHTFQYNINGNLSRLLTYQDNGTEFELDGLTYGEQPGIMVNCTTPAWWFNNNEYMELSKTNIVLSHKYEGRSNYLYTYEFDADGYPVKVKQQQEGEEGSETLTLQYKTVN